MLPSTSSGWDAADSLLGLWKLCPLRGRSTSPDGDFTAASYVLGQAAARSGHPPIVPCPANGGWGAWAQAWQAGFQAEETRLAALSAEVWPVLTWGRAVALAAADEPAHWVTLTLQLADWHALQRALARAYHTAGADPLADTAAVRWIARPCPHYHCLQAVWLEIALADPARTNIILTLPPPLFPALTEIAATAVIEVIPLTHEAPPAPGSVVVRLGDAVEGCLVDVPLADLWAIHDRYFSLPPAARPLPPAAAPPEH